LGQPGPAAVGLTGVGRPVDEHGFGADAGVNVDTDVEENEGQDFRRRRHFLGDSGESLETNGPIFFLTSETPFFLIISRLRRC
jgi:hypothetical protein